MLNQTQAALATPLMETKEQTYLVIAHPCRSGITPIA